MREKISKDCRIWWAEDRDFPWLQILLRRYRDHEFFFVPDASFREEIPKGNILCCDYGGLEAGYIWGTCNPRSGKSRINQVAISEDLWRNGVGSLAVAEWERKALSRQQWGIYLSCNTNTPGHSFWPTLGYEVILRKEAGRRGGENLIWAKLLTQEGFLFAPEVSDLKSTYQLQYSLALSQKKRAGALASSLGNLL